MPIKNNDSEVSMTKIQSTAVLIFVVMIAFGVAWAGGQNTPLISLGFGFALPLLMVATLLVFIIQWLAFIPAFIKRTEHFYDLVGGMTYLLLIGGMFVFSQQADLRAILLTTLVSIWALRLSIFLFKRVGQDGSDSTLCHFWSLGPPKGSGLSSLLGVPLLLSVRIKRSG